MGEIININDLRRQNQIKKDSKDELFGLVAEYYKCLFKEEQKENAQKFIDKFNSNFVRWQDMLEKLTNKDVHFYEAEANLGLLAYTALTDLPEKPISQLVLDCSDNIPMGLLNIESLLKTNESKLVNEETFVNKINEYIENTIKYLEPKEKFVRIYSEELCGDYKVYGLKLRE